MSRSLLSVFLVPLSLLLASPSGGWAQTPDPPPSVPAQVTLEEIRSAVEAVYHKPGELEESHWADFWIELEDGFTAAESHAELRAAFRSAARGLGISHFSLQRQAPSADGGSGREPVRLSWPDPEVALLEVDFFSLEATAEPLVRALTEVSLREVPSLVVDLRENPGGDISAMILAGHLITEPVLAGIFISRRWWEENDALPALEEWSSLPVLSELDLAPFQDALSNVGALVGVVPPMSPTYRGQVYILTGPNTGSASEPVVHLLREAGLVTVVGERTAGAMLSSETVTLSDGWHLVIPAADYIAADGVRLEGRGVPPHVEVPVDQALEETLRMLRGNSQAHPGAPEAPGASGTRR